MHGINNSGFEPPLTRARARALAQAGNHAGRSITLADTKEKQKLSLQDLASDTLSMIFCHLKLRDIRSLQKVSTRLRDVIEQDNALAKAWYRQFTSAHQQQLRMALSTKNKDQLRAWFESFTNNRALVESLTDRRSMRLYSPGLLFFTKAKLMSVCDTFELVTKATLDKTYKTHSSNSIIDPIRIRRNNRVHSAALSVDGRFLVTTNGDNTVKIYSHKPDGTWEKKTIIPHVREIKSAIFSSDGHHLVTASSGGTVTIYNLRCDETWEPNTIISHNGDIKSANFSANSRHVVTTSWNGTAKIHSRKDDGSWELTATLPHKTAGASAIFSIDGCHVLTTSDNTVKIHSQKDDGSWEEKDAIPHVGDVLSATFSAEGHYLVATGLEWKAKIYGQKADGSWKKNTTIQHWGIVRSARFSNDGRHLLITDNDNKVKIYGRKANGLWKKKATFFYESYGDWTLSATFSPEGRHMLTTACYDNTVKIIGQQDDGTWIEKATITHDDWISSATFNADGSQVVTSSRDGIVKITELRRKHSWSAVTE
ncbi:MULTISPECIES: F-box/WD repeat-containing protein [unclassified Endozoicomonas]|uniref:F-box/WD repeat-containing protein n=2 Tax=Endozoicomonas TaxID=305899 RepID=UPI003BB49793